MQGRLQKSLTVFAAAALALAAFSVPFSRARGDVSGAMVYLAGKTGNPWVTMAESAAGAASNVEYLKDVFGTKAIDFEAPMLALAAAGKDPRTFGTQDLVTKLQSFVSGGQIGDPTILNDDIFGLLALSAASVPNSDASVSGPRQLLLDLQNEDGGWGFANGGSSDTNTTAAAIMALVQTGSGSLSAPITAALDYLRMAQNTDGGFPYDPHSAYGTDSDASSDAWVIMAIRKTGGDPAAWSKPGGTPIGHLQSLQTESGWFHFQSGYDEDVFTPVTTSYAVMALAGKSLPVGAAPAAGGSADTSATSASFRIEGSAGLLCSGSISATTALDVVKNAAVRCNFDYHIQDTAYGAYLDRIGADEAAGSTGWLYFVNAVAPSVGAENYELEDGDDVIWHFGGYDWTPSQAAIGLSVNVLDGGQVAGASDGEIAFSVDMDSGSSINFGSLPPGGAAQKAFKIRNEGGVTITVRASVSGDGVFRDNIFIDGLAWDAYAALLAPAAEKNSTVRLALPAGTTARGQKSGSLIFWAQKN